MATKSDDERSFFSENQIQPPAKTRATEEKPHYLGHRDRLRQRFATAGSDALPDYELLELLLFRLIPRADTKPVAKALLTRFGTLAEVLGAPVARLEEVKGIGPAGGARSEDHCRDRPTRGTQRDHGPRGLVDVDAGPRILPVSHGLRGT
ncbi:hypothetical protein GCM10010869_01890 [Mesorhizobium tianshanense]|nr:hypothetical protein GCM10010869_01890 [Mesorhizobium tianshanense]